MSAETFTAVVRPASIFSTEKKKCGSQVLNATEQAALSGCATVAEALDVLSGAVARGRAVSDSPKSIGLATSVDNS